MLNLLVKSVHFNQIKTDLFQIHYGDVQRPKTVSLSNYVLTVFEHDIYDPPLT